MKNKNFDKKYAELSALIDDFIATISSTPQPDFSGMAEQEFRSQWHEFEKTSLCAFLSEVKKIRRLHFFFALYCARTIPSYAQFSW